METPSDAFLEMLKKIRQEFRGDAGALATRAALSSDTGTWLNSDDIVGVPSSRYELTTQ